MLPVTATRGTWSSITPITQYAYLWLRCNAQGQACYALDGFYVSASTYTLRAEDAGSTIRVRVFARNADGTTESADSAATAVVS